LHRSGKGFLKTDTLIRLADLIAGFVRVASEDDEGDETKSLAKLCQTSLRRSRNNEMTKGTKPSH
jgi:hypothetical protein